MAIDMKLVTQDTACDGAELLFGADSTAAVPKLYTAEAVSKAAGSLVPAANKLVMAGADGKIDSAWLTSGLAADEFPAVDTSFFPSTALVTAIKGNTRNDSDGGAWRKQCSDTSWYNETIYGKYLGTRANEAAARINSIEGLTGETLNLISGDGASVSEWSPQDFNIIREYISNELRITLNSTSSYVWRALNTVAGRLYKITATVRAGTNATGLYIGARDGASGGTTVLSENSATSITSGTYTLYFTASSSTTSIRFITLKSVAPGVSYLDDFTVREYNAANAITGDYYYYDSTAALFKSLNAGSGTTTVYRGNRREFPESYLITAESARVVIWDCDYGEPRMWKVIDSTNVTTSPELGVFRGMPSYAATSLCAKNGYIFVGLYNAVVSDNRGVHALSFIEDKAIKIGVSAANSGYVAPMSLYKTVNITPNNKYGVLVNSGVNAVASTVQPGAPIDPATGLPMQTIAVGTDGGVSVLVPKSDYTYDVWDIVSSAGTTTRAYICAFTRFGRLVFSFGNSSNIYYSISCPIPSGDVTISNLSALPSGYINIYDTTDADQGVALFTIGSYGQYNQKVIPAFGNNVVKAQSSGEPGLEIYRENPTNPLKGMGAKITHLWNSGWLVGGNKRAWLADTVAETVTGTTVLEDDFSSYADDAALQAVWATSVAYTEGVATLDASDAIIITSTTTSFGAYVPFSTVIGETYNITVTKVSSTATAASGIARVTTTTNGSNLILVSNFASGGTTGTFSTTFEATTTTTYLHLICGTIHNVVFDNISIKLAEPDRSVNNKALTVVGSLTKAAVASGANLVGYSGFSASNYLEEAYSADLNFGTAAHGRVFWLKEAANSAQETIFHRDSASTAQRLYAHITTGGTIVFGCDDNTTDRAATSTITVDDGLWHLYWMRYDGAGGVYIYQDGRATPIASATGAALLTLNNASAYIRVGVDSAAANPLTNGTILLKRPFSGDMTVEQWAEIYETEKKLFEANAQCTLAGTSSDVLAVDYDDTTGITQVLTSYGRSGIKGLVRVESEATSVGTPKAVSADDGCIVQVGSTAVDYYAPSKNLRETPIDLGDKPRKLFDFDLSSATTCTLLLGWKPTGAVWSAGTKKREGAAKDFTITYDGFLWSVVMTSSTTAWVQIEGELQ